jgi:hypothetical protein
MDMRRARDAVTILSMRSTREKAFSLGEARLRLARFVIRGDYIDDETT